MAHPNQERNDLGGGAPRSADKPEHANGTLGEDDRWLRSVLENSSEIIKVVDPDGTLRYASPAFGRILGHDPEEAVGTMNVFDHVHPDDLAHVLEETEKALSVEGVGTNVVEYRFRHKDGSWRWMESVGTYLLEDLAGGGVVVLSRDVTDRKEAEKAIERLDRRNRLILDSAGEGIYGLDRKGKTTFVNPVAAALTGFGPEELIGGFQHGFVHHSRPDGTPYPVDECPIHATLRSGEVHRVDDEVYWRKDGTSFPVEYTSTPILEDGDVVGAVVTFTDITERRKAEEALREAENRYRTLVETVPAVTYTDRAVGSYPDIAVYTSPRIEALVGYSVEEWLDPERDLWGERLHSDDKEWVLAADERSKTTGEPFAEEYRLIAKDGSVVWVRDEAALMRSEAGEPLYWQGVLVDVTDRKKAEEALKQSERHFRAITQNSSDVVTLLTTVGTIRYQSLSVERILGYRPEEMVGGNAFDYVHPDDRERVEMAFAEGLVDPARRPSMEYRFRHKDGSWVWLESVGANLLGDPEVGEYVVNSRDVTKRKRAEEALRRGEASLAESQRIAHLGTWEWDLVTGEVRWSEETYRIHGFDPGEGIPFREKVDEAFFPEDLPVYRQKIEEALSGEAEGYDYEHRMRRSDGGVRWVHGQAEVIRGDGGEPLRMVGTVHDITERKVLEERLEQRALHDSLTGLPNRRLFVDRLRQALGRTRRRPKRQVGVLFMDLDDFKIVNDSLGHEAGDLLLVVVAERLRRCLRPGDTLARFGGDEFVVLIEAVDDPVQAVQVAERITQELRRPFILGGREVYASASIGISLGDAQTKTPEYLLRDADTAMYRAKDEDSDYRMFDPAMYERVLGRLKAENDLRRAIERGEFVVHYQPIVSLSTGKVSAVEALVRWDHPKRGLLDPSEFVAVAEESGLVIPMGEQVLREACLRAKERQERHTRTPPLEVSVNLSARQIYRPDLVENVERVLRETGLQGNHLTLDVTETVYVEALEGDAGALGRLRDLGVKVSIDDFGTGYSSLAYLKRLPADAIKIDKSFTRGLGYDVEDTAVVRMVIELAHTFGMEVIAEGVETEEQVALLEGMGCGFAQGYHLARPTPSEELDRLLEKGLIP